MSQVITIHTDGACKGNPGPGGWGVILQTNGAEKELFGGEHDTTNNRMEMTAVIQALQALSRPCAVELYTDSEYVIKGSSEWLPAWKKRNWRTAKKEPVKNADLWKLIDEQLGRHDVVFHWVRGHSGHALNERADALANKGVASLKKDGASRPALIERAPAPDVGQGTLEFNPVITVQPSIRIYADGSSRKTKAGGWGVVIINHGVETEMSGWSFDTTNNRMELEGPIQALQALPVGRSAHITTDSEYVQKGIEEWIKDWRKRGWRTSSNKPVKNVDLWVKLETLCAERKVSWAWVKGHSGDHYNERADGLAQEASLHAQGLLALEKIKAAMA
jgi:ribonuclease HI